MTREDYENLECQFCSSNDQQIREFLKCRYSELKDEVHKDRSFKDFMDHYFRPPNYIQCHLTSLSFSSCGLNLGRLRFHEGIYADAERPTDQFVLGEG